MRKQIDVKIAAGQDGSLRHLKNNNINYHPSKTVGNSWKLVQGNVLFLTHRHATLSFSSFEVETHPLQGRIP